jgi:hypothetical protein
VFSRLLFGQVDALLLDVLDTYLQRMVPPFFKVFQYIDGGDFVKTN